MALTAPVYVVQLRSLIQNSRPLLQSSLFQLSRLSNSVEDQDVQSAASRRSSSRDSTTKGAPFLGSGNTRRSLKSMSSLSVMEWNAKPPLQWEWESAAAAPITSKEPENTKIWPSIDWGIDVDEQIASGSLISYQGDCGSGVSSGGTSFDLGYASMSKSSKSTSMSSSSTEDEKMFKLSVEAAGKDFISKKDDFSGTSPTFESSVCSGEPLLSLKLGKRAYFEDISDGNNSKTFPLIVRSPEITAKRTRSSLNNISAACCQVEGCNLDLSSAKDYHRKHKVCANHSKSSKVIVNGVERRFCQQCSRFHGLAEFDENKRSCRKRLSDHNARRRRPHPNVAHFDPTRLSTIIYGGGLQHMSPVFSRIPVEENSKSSSNISWSNTSSSINFKAAAAVKHEAGPTRHGNMILPDSMRRNTTLTQHSVDASYGLLGKIHGGGGGGSAQETSLISSTQPPQHLHRALSLLSIDARDSSRPRSVPVPVPVPDMVKPWTYGVPPPPAPGLASSAHPELWQAEEEQWKSNSQRQTMNTHIFNNGNGFQECLLSEGHHEFGFDLMHLN